MCFDCLLAAIAGGAATFLVMKSLGYHVICPIDEKH